MPCAGGATTLGPIYLLTTVNHPKIVDIKYLYTTPIQINPIKYKIIQIQTFYLLSVKYKKLAWSSIQINSNRWLLYKYKIIQILKLYLMAVKYKKLAWSNFVTKLRTHVHREKSSLHTISTIITVKSFVTNTLSIPFLYDFIKYR